MPGSGPNATPGPDAPADAGEAILRFASSRPTWMQDALRRVTVGGQLDDEERGEVLRALKAHHGLLPPSSPPVPPLVPMSRDHVRAFTGRDVRLLSIAEPKDVNRLAPGQVLSFSERGITVAYGDNGSGKTSYFRIPKSVCRGRAPKPRRGHDRPQILGDVYRSSGTPPTPQARLKLLRAGSAIEVEWQLGRPVADELRDVHVFDHFAVPIYVDEDCSHEFVPFGLHVFDDLAELCRVLDGALQQEIAGLRREGERLRPSIAPNTAAGRFVASVNRGTTDEQIVASASWSGEDEAELTRLEAALGDGRQLVRLTDARRRVEAVRARCATLEAATRDSAAQQLRLLIGGLEQAEAMATRITSEGMTDAPLGGVGSEPWRAMFRAARRFSEEVAYPALTFPNTGPDSRCVLCQEALSDAARQRMRRFEELAGEEAQRGVTEAQRRLDEAVTAIPDPDTVGSLRSDLEAALASLGGWLTRTDGTDLLERVEHFQQVAAARATAMRRAGRTRRADALTLAAVPPSPVADLEGLLAEVVAVQARAEQALQGRTESEARRAELQARKHLAGVVRDVRGLVLNHATIHGLEACSRDLNTRAITAEGTRLKATYVNAAFQEALIAELRALRLTDIDVRIDARGERGVMITRLRLAGATSVAPGEVLSRGEQQVLAIACFLAELEATQSAGATIFDDPISSLDRDRSEEVARRLVKLAAMAIHRLSRNCSRRAR